jgi:pyruvate/2-oxoglutarate dehydrogenase complex dihydrolipoamide acyltransferase (E2) component
MADSGREPDAQNVRVKNQTWTRLGTAQKAGVIVAAVVVPVAGVLAVIGAVGGDSSAPAANPERQPAASATAVASASAPAPVAGKSPGVGKRTITETEPIAFKSRTVKDNWLPKGTREPRTAGIDGVRTKTYEVTLVDGRETKRKLLKSEVTREPVPEVVAVGTNTGPDDNANG